jgi:hypothetical protein
VAHPKDQPNIIPVSPQPPPLPSPARGEFGHLSSHHKNPECGGGDITCLIPYKNSLALASYYLGVFALIPCLGIPLGLAAVITGIKGLRFAAVNKAAGGRIHAYIGIIAGSLFTSFNLIIFIISMVFIFGNRWSS